MKMDEMQRQLNKVVEENVRLRSTSQQRSPTTPTSPLPVIMEPSTIEEEEEGGVGSEEYAQVDMLKVSNVSMSSCSSSFLFLCAQKTSHSSTSGSQSGSRSSVGESQAPPPMSPRQTGPIEDMYTVPVKKSSSDVPSTVTPPPGRQDTPLSDSPFEGKQCAM